MESKNLLYKHQLHDYQREAVDFIFDKKKCALFLGLGAGKTVSALTSVSELYDGLAISGVLIIAPLRIANSVWHKELAKWSHLKGLTYSICTGSPDERRRAIMRKADIHIINRENIPWLVDKLGQHWKWDMVIVDELTSFKSHSSKRFKALAKMTPKVEYFVGLTATPTTNGYADLWAQMFLIDQGKRLGRNISAFRSRYMQQNYNGFGYSLRPPAKPQIQEAIKDVVMAQEDVVKVAHHTVTRSAPLPDKLKKQYKALAQEYVLELESDNVQALSAAALGNKLSQFCNGFIYKEDGDAVELHNLKIELLKEVIEESAGEPILVAYNFKHDLEMLKRAFPQGREIDKKFEVVDDWQAGKVPLLFAHPQSAGHGLDGLQHGGKIIVWFGASHNLEYYQQLNGRIKRQGQKDLVTIVHLVIEKGQDEKIYEAIDIKAETQEELLDYLKANLLC